MRRYLSCHVETTLSGRMNVVWSVAAAVGLPLTAENLLVSVDGTTVETQELEDHQGSRLHQFVAVGRSMSLDYRAEIDGQAEAPGVDPVDLISYLRPSRYCESDTLGPTAASLFGDLSGQSLLAAVRTWVHDHLAYVSGSSDPTDGAEQTLLARQGVCRDFTHLVIALLRARNVPARMVSVYAPGLSPMDFHAVAEAYVDGAWYVVDATGLAPRQSMTRIATGRDAADTAFLTNHWTSLTLDSLQVVTVVDSLPYDNGTDLVQLR